MTQHDPLAGSDTYDILAGLPHKQGGHVSKLVDDLRKWGSLKVGQLIPEELARPNEWGPPLTKLLNDAADRIEYLEAHVGAVSQGSGDFRTIASNLPRNEPKTTGC